MFTLNENNKWSVILESAEQVNSLFEHSLGRSILSRPYHHIIPYIANNPSIQESGNSIFEVKVLLMKALLVIGDCELSSVWTSTFQLCSELKHVCKDNGYFVNCLRHLSRCCEWKWNGVKYEDYCYGRLLYFYLSIFCFQYVAWPIPNG